MALKSSRFQLLLPFIDVFSHENLNEYCCKLDLTCWRTFCRWQYWNTFICFYTAVSLKLQTESY